MRTGAWPTQQELLTPRAYQQPIGRLAGTMRPLLGSIGVYVLPLGLAHWADKMIAPSTAVMLFGLRRYNELDLDEFMQMLFKYEDGVMQAFSSRLHVTMCMW